MERITFLDNAYLGKNQWWRYLLNLIITWVGPILLFLIILIPLFILNYPFDAINPGIWGNNTPLVALLFLGTYYTLAFALFYTCSHLIQGKKILDMITTSSQFNWRRMLKGASLWSLILGVALLVDVLLNPTQVNLKFDWSFFRLLLLSLIIFSIQASFEEIFFRGYLLQGMGLLTRKPLIAILATSLLFAVGHLGNGPSLAIEFLSVFNMFILGMVLGIITLGENSLETAIGIHIANNVIVTTLGNGLNFLGDYSYLLNSGTGISLAVPYFILLFFLLALIFWRKNDKLSLILKTHWRLSDPYPVVTELQCIDCETINPSIANYCQECGNPLLIEYASTPRKVLAFLIDVIILAMVAMGLLVVIFLIVYLNPYFDPILSFITWVIISKLVFFVYMVLMEKHSKTVGKMITGLRVVDEYTLKPISYRQSILRNFMLIVDLFPFILPGLVGLILSAKSDEKQRMGDMAAETIVIRG